MADPSIGSSSGQGEEIRQGSKKKKRMILIGGFLLFILMMAGTVILFPPGFVPKQLDFLGRRKPSTEKKEIHPRIQGHLYKTEPFVVNLADSDVSRYLKIRIDIESFEAKPNEEFQKRLPQLRDAILTILSNKTYREIYDSEGKRKLKEEVIQKVNQLTAPLRVKTIYFTEFVVQ